jgi:exonuclease SbcD
MKILHTSDWHIGRQFHHVSLLEDQRYALDQLVDLIKRESVDVLIIAGDIYDRSVPPAAAVALLDDVLKKIGLDLQVPVVMIPGNHDSAERLGFGSAQMQQAGLHILADLSMVSEPVVISRGAETCHFYGIPYHDPEHVRDVFETGTNNYQQALEFLLQQIDLDDSVANIVLSHSFVAGGEASESERPLSIGGADQVSADLFHRFDYAALGHLHAPQIRNAPHIRYSGSLLKYSFSEQNHDKGVTLLEISDNQISDIRHYSLKPLRNLRTLEGALDDILAQGAIDPQADDYIMVRLSDTHAILDAMGKLREVYPNVLHLEKTGLMAAGSTRLIERDEIKRNELGMFEDFFQQTTGQALSAQQTEALQKTIEMLHKNSEKPA